MSLKQDALVKAVCLEIEEHITEILARHFPFYLALKEPRLCWKVEKAVRIGVIKYALYATKHSLLKAEKRIGISRETIRSILKKEGLYESAVEIRKRYHPQ